MITNGITYDYSVSVFIAAKGTPSPNEPSTAGHMWIGLEDYTAGYKINYYGFQSGNHSPKGPGVIVSNDNETYQYCAYTIKFPLTKEQYQAINDFIYQTQNSPDSKGRIFGGYNVLTNSCVDFSFACLREAGIGAYRSYITQDGRLVPMWNTSGLEEIHQSFLNKQGYPGESKYWEHGTGGADEWVLGPDGKLTLPETVENNVTNTVADRGQQLFGVYNPIFAQTSGIKNVVNTVENSVETANNPDSIGTRSSFHDMIMNIRNLEIEQERLKKEYDQHKGEPLTQEKAEQLAKSSYVNGEDEQLAQQMKALQTERAQLHKDETWNKEFDQQNGFDSSFWRYVPDWMKSDELKDYEHNTKVIEQKKKDLNRRESEIGAKSEKLQEQLRTQEARATIEEQVQQYLAKDAERLTKLEHIETKLSIVQKDTTHKMQKAAELFVKGSNSPEQSMVTWQRVTEIMNVEPRSKIPGTEKLLIGEAREYRIQAKAIIEREGYWPGQAADAEIAGNMYMKGYSKERVSLAFMDASPETVNNTINQNIQYGRDIAAQAFTSNIQLNMPSPGISL